MGNAPPGPGNVNASPRVRQLRPRTQGQARRHRSATQPAHPVGHHLADYGELLTLARHGLLNTGDLVLFSVPHLRTTIRGPKQPGFWTHIGIIYRYDGEIMVSRPEGEGEHRVGDDTFLITISGDGHPRLEPLASVLKEALSEPPQEIVPGAAVSAMVALRVLGLPGEPDRSTAIALGNSYLHSFHDSESATTALSQVRGAGFLQAFETAWNALLSRQVPVPVDTNPRRAGHPGLSSAHVARFLLSQSGVVQPRVGSCTVRDFETPGGVDISNPSARGRTARGISTNSAVVTLLGNCRLLPEMVFVNKLLYGTIAVQPSATSQYAKVWSPETAVDVVQVRIDHPLTSLDALHDQLTALVFLQTLAREQRQVMLSQSSEPSSSSPLIAAAPIMTALIAPGDAHVDTDYHMPNAGMGSQLDVVELGGVDASSPYEVFVPLVERSPSVCDEPCVGGECGGEHEGRLLDLDDVEVQAESGEVQESEHEELEEEEEPGAVRHRRHKPSTRHRHRHHHRHRARSLSRHGVRTIPPVPPLPPLVGFAEEWELYQHLESHSQQLRSVQVQPPSTPPLSLQSKRRDRSHLYRTHRSHSATPVVGNSPSATSTDSASAPPKSAERRTIPAVSASPVDPTSIFLHVDAGEDRWSQAGSLSALLSDSRVSPAQYRAPRDSAALS